MLPQKIAFVDLETTGTSAQHDRIIEVGIVRFENGEITDTYSSLVNPQTHFPPYITQITGIKPEDVISGPTFDEIADNVSAILDDCVFVAHNVRFDYSFLKHEFARLDKQFTKRHFCTVRLSRVLFPHQKRHNLDAIIERFKIDCQNRHRALDDASVLVRFYTKAQEIVSPDIFSSAVASALKQPTLPSTIAKEVVSSLPESPGVYMFFGEHGMPLYIGKSINIKDRVLSHFSSSLSSPKEMSIARQTHSIEAIETAGELGALFLESALIKQHLPLYNRRLRYTKDLVVLLESTNEYGYSTVTMSHLSMLAPETTDHAKILGIYKSKKDAKTALMTLVKEFQLCEKLFGLEKTKLACFSARLDICKGACTQNEKPLFYNLRFTTAFSKSRLSTWPFRGPIVITETNVLTKLQESFLFDKWCLIGRKTQRPDAHSTQDLYGMKFDLDMYKILRGYLRNKRNGVAIHNITASDINQFADDTSQAIQLSQTIRTE